MRGVVARRVGRFTARLTGPSTAVVPALQRIGAAWQYDGREVWRIPNDRLDDALAALELAGHHVDYQEALW